MLCKELVGVADEALDSNATVTEVENAMLRVCQLLGNTLQPPCTDYVEENAAAIVHLLINYYLDPTQVCEALKVCP